MKREIKFRAWLEGTHDNITFTDKSMEYNITVSKGVYADVEKGWDIQGHYPSIAIMQFTGLKDKNGKDIYEGDIVKFQQDYIKPTVVYWNDEMTGFYPLISERSIRFEVIGNIHENPELLAVPTAVL